jgi:hypothetical protein
LVENSSVAAYDTDRPIRHDGEWPPKGHPQTVQSTPSIMTDNVSVELTRHQRDLVLEGLRYIRSSRRFEFRDTSAPPDERRDTDLRVIGELMSQLDSSTERPTRTTA